jgi:hypothetical protein
MVERNRDCVDGVVSGTSIERCEERVEKWIQELAL